MSKGHFCTVLFIHVLAHIYSITDYGTCSVNIDPDDSGLTVSHCIDALVNHACIMEDEEV